MKVDKKLIEHIAGLARLELTNEEKERFAPQVKEILDVFAQLDEVDTREVKESFQPVELKNVMREDKAGKCLDREKVLSLTEHKKEGYFKGPKAI